MLTKTKAVKHVSHIQGAYQMAYECWQAESVTARNTTHERYLNTIQSLAHFLSGKPLPEISRKDIADFSTHLINAGNSPVTSKQKIGILKTIFNSAINKEILDKNPTDSFKLPYRRPHKARVGFALEDLERIFRSPIYTQGYLPLGGGKIACFWLPLLALYTGARIEELAQLQPGDVQLAKGLGYYLNISDLDKKGVSLKNTHSRRRIPIHPVLLACGFLQHVKVHAHSAYLFPDLKLNPRGKRGGYFSNWFSAYLRKKVGISDARKVFHSFRHSFKDLCRQNGIEEAVHDALTGHQSASISRQYGNDQFPLAPLFKAIEKLEITGLDLSHLFEQPLVQTIRVQDVKIIAAFYGLAVGFTTRNNGKNAKPALIVIYQDSTAGIDLQTSELLFGTLPEDKRILISAWSQIHRAELWINWQSTLSTGTCFSIDPLR